MSRSRVTRVPEQFIKLIPLIKQEQNCKNNQQAINKMCELIHKGREYEKADLLGVNVLKMRRILHK